MMSILRRLGSGVITVILVVLLAFLLLEAIPGDPLGMGDDPTLSLEDRAHLEEIYGLDQPLMQRFTGFVSHALRGDLGISLRYHRPVSRVLLEALWPTMLLGLSAILVAFLVGVSMGTAAALRPGSAAAFFVHRVLPALDALPPFWLGLVAIWVFSWKLGVLPASHMHSANLVGLHPLDLLLHLLLPCLVVGLPGAAPIARHHATSLLSTLHSAPIRMARGLGVDETRLTLRATRAALHPIITLLGLALPITVGGVVVVEVVFSWPGIGRLQQEALLARDLPLVLGGLLLIATAVVLGTIIADLLSAAVDPRWRTSSGMSRR